MKKPREDRQEVITLPVTQIVPNPAQPRSYFDPQGLRELASSIAQHGILQPLAVRRVGGGRFELVAGERRLRAAQLLGLSQVPCLVLQVDELESSLLALVENLQRRDLDYFEVAQGYQRLIACYGLTQTETAQRVGKSQSSVANKLRLLRFDASLMDFMRAKNLTERHARSVLRLPPERCREALEHIAAQGLTVAQTEAYVDSLLAPPAPPVPTKPVPLPPANHPRPRPAPRPLMLVRDVRIFLNTINRALELMRGAGIPAECSREEDEEALVYTIRIAKSRSLSAGA